MPGRSEKYTVVLLAGGNRRFSFREFLRQLEDFFYYHELYFKIGFKALKRFRKKSGGTPVVKHLFEFPLGALQDCDRIGRIIIVGPKKEILDKAGTRLFSDYPKAELIDQGGSFGENVMRGYRAAGKRHVLFAACDTPYVTSEAYCEFLDICESDGLKKDEYGAVVGRNRLGPYEGVLRRPYLKILPKGILPADYFKISEYTFRKGREGIRLANMALLDLQGFTTETVDTVYRLRKPVSKSVRQRIKKIVGRKMFRQYHRGITSERIMQIFHDFIRDMLGIDKSFQMVGLSSAAVTFDVDSRYDEKRLQELDLPDE
ncbi:MAG: hypothetical protein CVT48_05330 [Thermoplasmata archaeon HGW-Thermoplasmata-1]|nr:MAG: hypothetical protein CVT48_05330 [Thermoplasmata archaeon HGW-Thermoplasmata-1]